jgi:hypothetical protein
MPGRRSQRPGRQRRGIVWGVVAGPSPEGRARNGQAVDTPLFALARRAVADPANSGVACPMLGPIPGTRETGRYSRECPTLSQVKVRYCRSIGEWF